MPIINFDILLSIKKILLPIVQPELRYRIMPKEYLSMLAEDQQRNYLLNSINHQSNINKIYLYAKDPYQQKCQFLINKREKNRSKQFKGPKTFVIVQMIYQMFTITLMNKTLGKKIYIVFGIDLIADIFSNKTIEPIVTNYLFLVKN